MISIKQLLFLLFFIPAPSHPEEKTIEQLLNTHTQKDVTELKELIKKSSKRADSSKIIAHYQTILKNKWNILEADFDTALAYSPGGLFLKIIFQEFKKEHLKKPYNKKQVKKAFSEPL